MVSFCLLIFTALVSCLIWLYFHFRDTVHMILTHRRAAEQFPYEKPHWLYGNFDQAKDSRGFHKLMQELTEKYNRKFVFWRGSLRPVLILIHPETVKTILKTAEPKPLSFGSGYKLLEGWIGDGLLLSNGKKWERNRKLLTPAFHFAILKPYINEYNKAVNVFLKKIENESKLEEFVEVTKPISLLTLDVMLRCAFSYEGRVQEVGATHPYVAAIHTLSDLVFKRAVNPVYWSETLYNWTADGKKWKETCDFVHNFSSEIIESRKKTLQDTPDVGKSRHLDFLDILLTAKDESGEGLTDQEIRDEADTFLFEGHDTTASALSWIMYALAKYPDVQHRVYTEIQGVLGPRTEVEWDDLTKLSYTQLFMKEALRMYSPVYQISRQTSKDCEIDGCFVPAGMGVNISMMNINHNPAIWKNHQVFDPERFAVDDLSDRDPYKFVPFSAGPRFRLELNPDHEAILMPLVVMRAEKGIQIKFVPRKEEVPNRP